MNSHPIIHLPKDVLKTLNQSQVWVDENFQIHQDIIEPLIEFCSMTFQQGLPIALISGFRNYQKQAQIWDDKVSGKRPILDKSGIPITKFDTEEEKFIAIAKWSAIPGLSRHHWGTDIDIFDANRLREGHSIKLIEDEFKKGGPCEKLAYWLNTNLHKTSFYRPYLNTSKQNEIVAINPEPWHISFKPIADKIGKTMDSDYLIDLWRKNPFCASMWCIQNAHKIFSRNL